MERFDFILLPTFYFIISVSASKHEGATSANIPSRKIDRRREITAVKPGEGKRASRGSVNIREFKAPSLLSVLLEGLACLVARLSLLLGGKHEHGLSEDSRC